LTCGCIENHLLVLGLITGMLVVNGILFYVILKRIDFGLKLLKVKERLEVKLDGN